MTKNFLEIQQQLLGTFLEESFEGLERVEAGLLQLERGEEAGGEVINDIFRAAHSIKGGAGSFGLGLVGELGHAMETLLETFRTGRHLPDSETLALLLEAVDTLRVLLESVRDGEKVTRDSIDELRARLNARVSREAAVVAPEPEAAPEVAMARFQIDFRPHPHLLETGNDPVRLFRELERFGSLEVNADLSDLPPLGELEPAQCHLAWQLALEGPATRAQIEDVFSWVEGDADLTVRELDAEPPMSAPVAEERLAPATEPSTAQAPALATKGAGGPSNSNQRESSEQTVGSIRVGVDKIDLLMNMVGELVITQSMLGELEGDGPLDAQRVARLREGLSQLARNTRSLQETVMRLRSVPISVVFSRAPRLVHDLSLQLNKRVELRIAGQTTELDKTVLEKLGDPLVHLIRNSLDHGLEPPDERRNSGKAEVGVLELRAYHRGGDLVVEVQDDGRGIDRDKVIARARSLGLLGPDEHPGEDAVRDLIFAPGFSTASAVTDVSGRGVGMDVVRRNIKALGGDVFVDTTKGRGTRISLRLPLTLAIIDGQLIRIGPHTYVIPLLSIVESVQVERARISRAQGNRQIYRVRDELIPVIDLAGVLGAPPRSTSIEDSLMVIVEAEGDHLGLLVDELLAQQQVVVKSLETNYGRVAGLGGATILGDGAVSFILDTAGVGRLVRGVSARDGARAA